MTRMERVGQERDVGGGWWGLVGGYNVRRRHKLPAKRRGRWGGGWLAGIESEKCRKLR